MTTVNVVAHPDDDILFLCPDLLSDVQAGHGTTVVYLTAGNLQAGPAGMPYADQRIHGVRAAYARAAAVADVWDFEPLALPDGRVLPTNRLRAAPHVRLAFAFVSAANGADDGDLTRMLRDPMFVARPIDGRPGYTAPQLVAMLRNLIDALGPAFLRGQDPDGVAVGDHIDHQAAGRFVMAANTAAPGGLVDRRLDTYLGYLGQHAPATWSGHWADEKLAMWQAYKAHDPKLAGTSSWDGMAVRQTRRHVWWPGDTAHDL
ncbi:PIG-L family deacetylase [Saccharothrix yanglingensis]|uniref:GlcNAc-PI de-N-acetylase n=1 Tax=Saccharothrix yanglingensis TaxID=659496 RepID=A0ABU0WW19_9PSEU|nr:PIG-L family deacetylase [Saccharothrix yanglingensis]MDQ2583698.1 hypothetical protein [Saccharothrix yanglingensis]